CRTCAELGCHRHDRHRSRTGYFPDPGTGRHTGGYGQLPADGIRPGLHVLGHQGGIKGKIHTHSHAHLDGIVHEHSHDHEKEHTHVHPKRNTTFWWLFIIFVLGPCEPLIPVLMYPAAKLNTGGVILVVLAFSLATIATMSVMVSLAYFGLKQVRFAFFERYAHALGGAIIALSGGAMIFLGL
ncbi:MAG: sulfite exporter TauE/SafE family protein, partial [Candidatus Aminicenantes bacterium]|nr:sulfite exporter TauE/SafE family protein [Candidatus Aminicenantes bacterium]